MATHVVEALNDHLARFVAEGKDAWLFSGRDGKPVVPRSLDRVWERARQKAGLEGVHLHDLRHSGNTWAAATGASTADLMARMGHASATAALRYQHATQEQDRALAQELDKLARGVSAGLERRVDGQ